MTTRNQVLTLARELITRAQDAAADFATQPGAVWWFQDYERRARAFCDLAHRWTRPAALAMLLRDVTRLEADYRVVYERAQGGVMLEAPRPGPELLARRFASDVSHARFRGGMLSKAGAR